MKQLKMVEDLQVTRQTFTAIEKDKYNSSLELALKIVNYFIYILSDEFLYYCYNNSKHNCRFLLHLIIFNEIK
nr:hypothetical protein [Virgibacillus ndiopensis]